MTDKNLIIPRDAKANRRSEGAYLHFHRWAVGSILLLICGCNPFYSVRMREWIPAGVALPEKVQKVALVNRSTIPEAERKRIMDEYQKRGVMQGALHGALRGGISGAAYGATGGALMGLIDEKWLEQAPQLTLTHLQHRLRECGRFEPLLAGTELKWMGSTEGSLPSPLSMDSLKKVHKKVPEVQAIIVLEMLLPGGSPQNPHVLGGFRVYDPATGKVMDEVTLTSESGEGYRYDSYSTMQAHEKLVEAYLHRICPCFIAHQDRIIRFYVKGSPGLQQAKPALIGRKWNEAIALWEKETISSKASAARRAMYNLALLYDAFCDTEKAEEWYRKAVAAGMAHTEYEKWGRERRARCEKLNMQLPTQKRQY